MTRRTPWSKYSYDSATRHAVVWVAAPDPFLFVSEAGGTWVMIQDSHRKSGSGVRTHQLVTAGGGVQLEMTWPPGESPRLEIIQRLMPEHSDPFGQWGVPDRGHELGHLRTPWSYKAGESFPEYLQKVKNLPWAFREMLITQARQFRHEHHRPKALRWDERYPPDVVAVAHEWFNSRNEECMDRFRLLREGDGTAAKREYYRVRESGCCGSREDVLTYGGEVYKIGFNYGH